MDNAIRIDRDAKNIATLTFDMPGKPVNTFGPAVLDELKTALDEMDRNPPTGLIFASAKKKSFAAGADLFEVRKMNRDQLEDYLKRGQEIFSRIEKFPFPTVAAINGDCLGGGCELTLA